MSVKTNFHTHTVYCDGRDTPEDMVRAAVDRGFTSIGFSGHSHTAFDENYAMSPDTAQKYHREIMRLKEKYASVIEILCGIEQDFYSDAGTSQWDYVIGSVHYILKDGEYFPDDESSETLRRAADMHYGGDICAVAEDFFATEAKVVEKTGCDIIGHFDIITKFNEIDPLFDISEPRYVAAYRKALDELIPYGRPFEINTGGIARGYRTSPYPSAEILREIFDRGGKIIFSSDAHAAETIDFGLDDAAALARSTGFRKASVMTERGPEEVDI